MSKIKRFILRFKFAWGYAYDGKKWKEFKKVHNLKDPLEDK